MNRIVSARGWAVPALLALALAACDDGPTGPNSRVDAVQVTPGEAALLPTDTVVLAASATGGGAEVAGASVQWTSLDTTVAVVSAGGVVTARAAGETRIVAAVGTVADTAVVSVVTAGPSGVPFLSMGGTHSCYLDAQGRALCWGDNAQGSLGNGTTISSATPVPVSGGRTFAAIAAGSAGQTCALTAAGEAYCWGDNRGGQVGDRTRESRSTPVRVGGTTLFSSIAANYNTCAVTRAGEAYCWGTAGVGETPSGPAPAFTGNDFAAVAPGYLFTCALRKNGEAVCKGLNTQGQLGNPSAPENGGGGTQYVVAGGHRFRSIATGTRSDGTCGVTASGTTYCWGSNLAGSLGTGDRGGATPVVMEGNPRMITAVPGARHGCGVTVDGGALCWGNNRTGQLGDGGWRSSKTPVRVAGGITFAAVLPSAPALEGASTCGITADHTLYCWGTAEGLSAVPVARSSAPVQPALPAVPSVIALGRQHGCALVVSAVYCWGDGAVGRLGTGADDPQTRPVRVQGSTAFTALSVGLEHSCAIATDGAVYCWGANYNGALGDNTTDARSVPSRATSDVKFASVAAGENHTCALTPGGEAYCWGQFDLGATGRAVRSWVPAPVNTTLRFASVYAGLSHTCALTAEGAAYCWGMDDWGQLGTTANTEVCGGDKYTPAEPCSRTPIAVAGGLRFSKLSAHDRETCGITTTGAAYCWGAIPRFGATANRGELGNGTLAGSQTPVAVSGGHRFTDISVENSGVCGVTTGRELLCWGGNDGGGIALGDLASATVPTPARGIPAPVTSVALGAGFGCAVAGTGTVCWGSRGFGLLGDGSWAGSTTPLRVTPG